MAQARPVSRVEAKGLEQVNREALKVGWVKPKEAAGNELEPQAEIAVLFEA